MITKMVVTGNSSGYYAQVSHFKDAGAQVKTMSKNIAAEVMIKYRGKMDFLLFCRSLRPSMLKTLLATPASLPDTLRNIDDGAVSENVDGRHLHTQRLSVW